MSTLGRMMVVAVMASIALTACGGGNGSTGALTPNQPPLSNLTPAMSSSTTIRPSCSSSAAVTPGALQPFCTASIEVIFNGKTIPPGSYLWFDSAFQLHGATSATFTMSQSSVTVGGQTYTGPNGVVTVDPSTSQATVSYTSTGYASSFGSGTGGKKFMDGIVVYLPNGLAAHQRAVWSANFTTTQPQSSMMVQWQFTVAAFSTLGTYEQLELKPIDGPNGSTYANHDKAGTPENYVADMIPGAREASGHALGAWSRTVMVTPCGCAP